MNTHRFPSAALVLIFLFFFPSLSHAQLFGGDDDEKWRRLFFELKKINVRVVEDLPKQIQTLQGQVKSLQRVQAETLSQIDRIQSEIPSLRGALEKNEDKLDAQISKFDSRAADMEAKVNFSLQENKKSQSEALDSLKNQVASQFEQFKNALVKDMETFAANNRDSFQSLAAKNTQSLEKIEGLLNAQNQNLVDTQDILKSEVIPAFIQQNAKDREALIAQLQLAKEENQKILSSSQEAILDGFQNLDSNNKKMIDILSQSLKQNQEVHQKIGALDSRVVEVQGNLDVAKRMVKKLKSIFDTRFQDLNKTQVSLQTQNGNHSKTLAVLKQNLRVAEEKINKLGDGIKTLQTQNTGFTGSLVSLNEHLLQIRSYNQLADEKFNKLVESSKSIATHSAQLEGKIDQSFQTLSATQASVSLTDEKLTRMIDILQTVAANSAQVDNKLDQTLGKLDAGQSHAQLADEKLTKMIDFLQKLAANSSQVDNKLDQTLGKLDAGQANSQANAQLADKKITKMIDFLQTVAAHSAELNQKVDQSFRKLEPQLANVNVVPRKLGKLIDILKTIAVEQGKMGQVLKIQAEIQERLGDLRRKANVNIARNDDIKKTLEKLQKKVVSTPAPKSP